MIALLALAVPPASAQPQDAQLDVEESARRIEADVRFLADDLLEGREAGTRGFDLAAAYVAAQYRHMGLQPAGENGTYFQTVPMLRGTRERDDAKFVIKRGQVVTELEFQHGFLPAFNYDTGACDLTAPMVFVGQAVHAPELKHDDFADVDLHGKVAVVLGNAPERFSNDQRAYYSSSEVKWRELERRGAVGVISLGDPVSEGRYPWQTGAANWARPGMRVLGADGRPMDTFPRLKCSASVPAAQADLLFAGTRYTGAVVFESLAKGKLEPFNLVGTVTMASRTRLEPVSSRNVIGKVQAGGATPAAAVDIGGRGARSRTSTWC